MEVDSKAQTVSSDKGVEFSADGGKTWTALSKPLNTADYLGKTVTLAGVADKNILPGQIGHVQRVRAGLPGLAAVRAVLHIRRGVQRLIVRVKDQHRSAGVLGDHLTASGPLSRGTP